MHKLFLLAAATVIFLLACRKNNPPAPPEPANPQSPVVPPQSPTVYIAGDSFDLSTQFLPYPVYWKNGKQVHLPHPGHSSGTGIVVSDSVVYVTSSGSYLGNNVTYWKNETGIDLSDPTIIYPTARNITSSGGDVYTVGGAYINSFEKFVPVYWKNREKAIKLSAYSIYNGGATSIAVAGNDVYITGSTYDPATGYGYSPACYWKNGVPTFLHSSTNFYASGMAKSICLSGDDVHVVGEVHLTQYAPTAVIATYWKNGKATELTGTFVGSVANCLFVSGNDVYIAGGIEGPDRLLRAAYWKNGVATRLDSTYSVANAITVFENDVYVAGNRGADTALYWKNGKPVPLGRGRANAIVVKK